MNKPMNIWSISQGMKPRFSRRISRKKTVAEVANGCKGMNSHNLELHKVTGSHRIIEWRQQKGGWTGIYLKIILNQKLK